MEIRINIAKFTYVGKESFAYKASDYKTYALNAGDSVYLLDDHFARALRKNPKFKEVFMQEKQETQKKQSTPKHTKVLNTKEFNAQLNAPLVD